MTAAEICHTGALNLYAAFWRLVILDLRQAPTTRRVHMSTAELVTRANTLAWLLDDELVYDEAGLPVSFRAWCRFGGQDLDPEWWRETLLSGNVPTHLRYEGEE